LEERERERATAESAVASEGEATPSRSNELQFLDLHAQ